MTSRKAFDVTDPELLFFFVPSGLGKRNKEKKCFWRRNVYNFMPRATALNNGQKGTTCRIKKPTQLSQSSLKSTSNTSMESVSHHRVYSEPGDSLLPGQLESRSPSIILGARKAAFVAMMTASPAARSRLRLLARSPRP